MYTYPTNTLIKKVERPGAFDRYGASRLETVYSQFRGYLENMPRFSRDADGDVLEVDAELVLLPYYELKIKDKITIENRDKDEYIVFDK